MPPSHIAIGDLNSDGNADLVTTHDQSGLVTILLGDGSGDFQPAPGSPLDLGRHAWKVIVADVNGDSRMDLVIRSAGEAIVVLLADRGGCFSPASGSPFTVGKDPFGVAVADVN